jgi:hypothetical protein
MDNLQPQPEERRLAQQACKIDERRLQPHAYEMPYDQETETAVEALSAAPCAAPPTPAAG